MKPKTHFREGSLLYAPKTDKLDTLCGRQVDRTRVEGSPMSLAELRAKGLDKYCSVCHEIRWIQIRDVVNDSSRRPAEDHTGQPR